MVEESKVLDALMEVIDPELGVNLVDLGLIYEVAITGERVEVTYSLTSPACPAAGMLAEQMQKAVAELSGVAEVETTLTFDPPWSPHMITEEGKWALDIYY